jgi:uncharacterized membrane protein
MDTFAALRAVPLFARMDDDEVRGIEAIIDEITFAPGQVIMRIGDPGDLFYVVIQGRVQFAVRDAAGREITVDEIGPGGFFGELSMLTGEPRAARVQALTEVHTLALDQEEFFAFLERQPPAAIDVLKVLGQRLHRSDTLVRQSVSKNVNDLADETLTLGQRVADMIADFSGSMPFLVGNVLWFGGWLLWNQPWFPGYDFDPYPFGLLTMIVSLEAIFLSIFVLISQNRQSSKDRLAAEVDHEVNTKAELGVGLLLGRLDDLDHSTHYNHDEAYRILKLLASHLLPTPPPAASPPARGESEPQ